MGGFTKLWQCILSSSIWNEDDKTRIVWITLLALKEEDGVARASVGGLAHMARVSKEDTEKAIKVLEQPDADSRSADFEGRRIEKVDGGFRILNHEKYRESFTDKQRKDYMKDYMRERRKEAKEELREDKTDTDTFFQANKSLHVLTCVNKSNIEDVESIYKIYPRKVAKQDAIKAIAKALKTNDAEFLRNKVTMYADKIKWQERKYIPFPATWFNKERYNDDPKEWENPNIEKKFQIKPEVTYDYKFS